jgi:hypothetical protein
MIGAIAGDMIGSVYEGKKQWLMARTAAFEPLFARPRGSDLDLRHLVFPRLVGALLMELLDG